MVSQKNGAAFSTKQSVHALTESRGAKGRGYSVERDWTETQHYLLDQVAVTSEGLVVAVLAKDLSVPLFSICLATKRTNSVPQSAL